MSGRAQPLTWESMEERTDYRPAVWATARWSAPLVMALVDWLVVAARFDVFQTDAMLIITGLGVLLAWTPRALADGMGGYIGFLGRGPMINRQSSGLVIQWMLRGLGWFFLIMPLLPSFDPSQ